MMWRTTLILLLCSYLGSLTITSYGCAAQTTEDLDDTDGSRPIPNAGPSVTLRMPDNSVTLSGNSSSAVHGIASFHWMRSPETQNLSADMIGFHTATLHLSNLGVGDHVFILEVTDNNGQTASDTVHVLVLPALKCSKPHIEQAVMLNHRRNASVGYNVGEMVEIRCNTGYRFPHRSPMIQLVCWENFGLATWHDVLGNDSPVTCERIGGCPVPLVDHGLVISKPGGYMPGEATALLCARGYGVVPKNSLYLLCQSDGTWKTANSYPGLPTCEEQHCGPPPEILHARIESPLLGSSVTAYPEGTEVMYYCIDGYKMTSKIGLTLVCEGSEWSKPYPRCVGVEDESMCTFPSTPPFGSLVVYNLEETKMNEPTVPEGSMVRYHCNAGYKLQGEETQTCKNGVWNGRQPSCMQVLGCSQLPVIPHGYSHYLNRDSEYGSKLKAGTRAYYFCDDGYRPKGLTVAEIVCEDGHWKGQPPKCEKSLHCDPPTDVANGNWVISGLFVDYRIGTHILYECNEGFKPIGNTNLNCDERGHWSEHPPKCVENEMYCSEPGPIENGFYLCRPNAQDLYTIGTEVHFVCNRGYEPRQDDIMVQMCLPGGRWSSLEPVCLPVVQNSDSTSDDQLHVDVNTSTLSVVIATSCSVLGLLLLVMVVFALQRRRKLSPRVLSSSDPSVPPPYSPQQENALNEEQDRVALIAFADGVQVVLPTYEEATRGRSNAPRLSRFNSDSSHGSGRSARADYRPLPSIPQSWRGGMGYPSQLPPDHHRNSIITTTSTNTRDNLSLAFGSMDTMNASDGTSTTVTIGTYDSAGSNPSIATSQRAAIGSLGSGESRASLATEDAPLLEQDNSGTEPPRCSTSHSHRETTSPQMEHSEGTGNKMEGTENRTL